MDITNLKCKICSGKLYGEYYNDDKELTEKVYDTEGMDHPLFAPTWDEYEIWEEDSYYRLICKENAEHEHLIFIDSGALILEDEFDDLMDKKEEDYLYRVVLKKAKFKTPKEAFVVSDKPDSEKILFISQYKQEALEEARHLNSFLEKDPERFKVYRTKTIVTEEVEKKL